MGGRIKFVGLVLFASGERVSIDIIRNNSVFLGSEINKKKTKQGDRYMETKISALFLIDQTENVAKTVV